MLTEYTCLLETLPTALMLGSSILLALIYFTAQK